MDKVLADRLKRVKELLATAQHAALATVNKDDTPHNSPVFFALDDKLAHFYWSSHPETVHSQNIERTAQAFVAVYDAVKTGGLFMRLDHAHAVQAGELADSLATYNKRRKTVGKEAVALEQYQTGPQKLYRADIAQIWLNANETDAEGVILRDYRFEIGPNDLNL